MIIKATTDIYGPDDGEDSSLYRIATIYQKMDYEPAIQLERALQVLIRPRPRWIPWRFWRWLVSRFVELEETNWKVRHTEW